jgi:hypothetical protein
LTGKSSEPEVIDAEVVDVLAPVPAPAPNSVDRRRETRGKLAAVEDELYVEALDTVRGLMKFAELDVGADGPPTEWVLDYGAAKAQKMYKLAQMGNMCRKDAPIGIQVALDLAKSERRARVNEQSEGKQSLNVAVVVMDKPATYFPTVEVDDVEE